VKEQPLAEPMAVPRNPVASNWNIANALTVFRLLLVPLFVFALFAGGGHDDGWRWAAWAVFAIASYTDRIDGQLARRHNLVTSFGKLVDPIADKALIGSALIGLSLLGDLPWWITVLVLVREVGVTLLRFWVIRHGVIPASLRAAAHGLAGHAAGSRDGGGDRRHRRDGDRLRGQSTHPPPDQRAGRDEARAEGAPRAVRGAVLAVGTELLLGDVVNSNAAWLGKQLAAAGVEVVASEALPDHVDVLVAAVHRHLAEVDVLLLCGGLGPTVDDLTRDAVAAALQAPLARDPRVEQQLRDRFAAWGRPMPDAVLRQADVPVGAEVLENGAGTAPGLWLERDGKVVVALPGPPHELRATATTVWPRLGARSGRVVTTRQVLLHGLGESAVAEQVEAALDLPPEVALSYLASGGLVRVRFTTTGDPAVLEKLVKATDEALAEHVWGHDDQTVGGIVHDALFDRGETVAVAESLTGGALSAALSERPGASTTFRGGLVVYATDLKESIAGVPGPLLDASGPVAADTAAALAAGARERLDATWGLAVTGVAGPEEQDGKPVGTVFLAVAGPTSEVVEVRLPGDRDRVRALTVQSAMHLLRKHVTR
jgi:nicotinamide-nucleotide amidase